MATSMMIQSAASLGSASLQTCSKRRVEAHSHTAYCVGILALICSYSYFLWFMNFNESSYVVTLWPVYFLSKPIL
jgi:hypothetical protein